MSNSQTQKALKDQATKQPILKELLSKERLQNYHASAKELHFYYGFSQVTDNTLKLLEQYAHELKVFEQFQNMISGQKINISENRAVTHHHSRNPESPYFQNEQKKALILGNAIFKDELNAISKTPFKTIVQIGIGGSELGTKTLYHAFNSCLSSTKDAKFIASVDPLGFRKVLQPLSLEETLFVIVSKSGSTVEIQENSEQLHAYVDSRGISWEAFQKQIVVITCPNSALDQSDLGHHRLYMTDSIGGRFSVTSPVGTFLLSCCFGKTTVSEFLTGAHELDHSATQVSLQKNPALIAALISYWERVFLGYSTQAIIAYSHALSILPSHLQQLLCESLGKHHNSDNERLTTPSGKLVFGDEGPNAQHSFFQLLHQGDSIIPIQFIGIRSALEKTDQQYHQGLIDAMSAQIHALAYGKDSKNAPDNFNGNRPSTTLLLDTLSPKSLGGLVSFYENMVFFEGLLLNINPFDQPGVELGKSVMKTLQEGSHPHEMLSILSNLLK